MKIPKDKILKELKEIEFEIRKIATERAKEIANNIDTLVFQNISTENLLKLKTEINKELKNRKVNNEQIQF